MEASPPSAGYRVRKFVRRNSGTVLAASVIVLLLAVGIFGTTIGLIRAEKLRVNALAAAEAQRLATLDAEKAAAAERVAKESAQHRLTQIENSNEILGSIFHDIDPRNEQAEGRPLRALLGDRLQEAAVKLDGEAVGDPLTVARLQRLLGDALYGLGDAEKAIPLFVKARATFTERRGADHLDTIQTMDHLALAYTALGRSKEALALHLEATGLAKAKYPDSQATLSVMHNLAWDYYSAGKSELAIPLLEETLKRRQVTLGPDDVRTLETMNALGLLYVESRKLDVALPLLDETVRLRKARLGPEHTDYLASLNNLAMAYNAAGKLDLALPRYEEVVRLITAKLGPDHPHTLTSMNNLAFTYRTAGKLDLALPLAERAAAGVEKRKYETENARKILFTLMDIYERLDRLDQADAWRRKWLAAVREKSGAESPPYATELSVFGLNLLQRKKWSDAETLTRESLAIRQKLVPDHWTTFNIRSQLGAALTGQGKYADAEPLLVEGYTGMKARLAKIPPDGRISLTESLERLVQLYDSWGKPAEAAKWRDELASLGKP